MPEIDWTASFGNEADRMEIPANFGHHTVIVLHGYGMSAKLMEARFSDIINNFHRQGIATVCMDLPFHGERAGYDLKGNWILPTTIDEIVQSLEQAAEEVNSRRLELEKEGKTVSMFSYSLGGAIAIAAHTRYKWHGRLFAAFPAIDIADLLVNSYAAAYAKKQITCIPPADELRARLLPVEPLSYAGKINPKNKPTILYGTLDDIIPRANIEKFIEQSSGRINIIRDTCGHDGGIHFADHVYEFTKEVQKIPWQRLYSLRRLFFA